MFGKWHLECFRCRIDHLQNVLAADTCSKRLLHEGMTRSVLGFSFSFFQPSPTNLQSKIVSLWKVGHRLRKKYIYFSKAPFQLFWRTTSSSKFKGILLNHDVWIYLSVLQVQSRLSLCVVTSLTSQWHTPINLKVSQFAVGFVHVNPYCSALTFSQGLPCSYVYC